MSKAEYEAHQARKARARVQPVKAEGELLAIFVPGRLVNTKNARLHYMAESRYKRGWRERVALALLEADFSYSTAGCPKHITFLATVPRRFDSHDGLRIALAPVLDALGECGVLTGQRERTGHGDEEWRGHEIIYQQQPGKAHGVEIRVRLKA